MTKPDYENPCNDTVFPLDLPLKQIDQSLKQNAGKPPVYQGVLQYFPRAIRAVAQVSAFGRQKYNAPWTKKGWLNVPADELRDAQCRHIIDQCIDGPVNHADGGCWHQAQVAWEALAALEIMLVQLEQEKADGREKENR